jgi:hypothetical protein
MDAPPRRGEGRTCDLRDGGLRAGRGERWGQLNRPATNDYLAVFALVALAGSERRASIRAQKFPRGKGLGQLLQLLQGEIRPAAIANFLGAVSV